jgi:hypothetical protein
MVCRYATVVVGAEWLSGTGSSDCGKVIKSSSMRRSWPVFEMAEII